MLTDCDSDCTNSKVFCMNCVSFSVVVHSCKKKKKGFEVKQPVSQGLLSREITSWEVHNIFFGVTFYFQREFTLTRSQRNFELSVGSNWGLHWLSFPFLCDWSRKLAPLFQPITWKNKNKLNLLKYGGQFTFLTQLLTLNYLMKHVFLVSSHRLLKIFPLKTQTKCVRKKTLRWSGTIFLFP